MSANKEIRSDDDRKYPHDAIPKRDATEAFAADYTRDCDSCGAKPVVNATGLCGPCTFGDAEAAGGNW